MKDEVDGISSTFREEQKFIQECGRETYRKRDPKKA
jgi:hypothetical protein